MLDYNNIVSLSLLICHHLMRIIVVLIMFHRDYLKKNSVECIYPYKKYQVLNENTGCYFQFLYTSYVYTKNFTDCVINFTSLSTV